MTHKLAALCLGLPVLGAAQPSLGEISIQRPAQVAHTERVNFAPGGTIRLNDSFGDLYIEGWDQPAVEMTLIKEMQDYRTPKNASEQLERVRFTTEHPSGNELTISTAIPSHSFFRHPFGDKGDLTVRYELHVPRDSRLRIHHGGGNILVGNVVGGIEATNRNGDIVLMLPGYGTYSIDAKSKMGTVISDFAGKAHRRHFVGQALTGTNESAAAHPIHLRVGFGGITIKEIPPEAEP
jgi:hypothetical protein